MSIRSFIKKLKIRTKTLIFLICLTIVEVILILWCNDWEFTPAIIATLLQFVVIFRRKTIFDDFDEVKDALLSEEDVVNLIKGIEKLCKEGESSENIIKKIKED